LLNWGFSKSVPVPIRAKGRVIAASDLGDDVTSMNDIALVASRFLIDHQQLQDLPELIGDHTGLIASTITVAFEAVAVCIRLIN
jgi:hypothetical protein